MTALIVFSLPTMTLLRLFRVLLLLAVLGAGLRGAVARPRSAPDRAWVRVSILREA